MALKFRNSMLFLMPHGTIQAAPYNPSLALQYSSIIIILLKKIPYNFSMHIHIITVIDLGVIAIFLIWTLMINNH